MLTKEDLKKRYEAINEHFTFKDFLGLSALIFGLLMSNSSFDPGPAKAGAASDKGSKSPKIEKTTTENKASSHEVTKKNKKKVLQIPTKKRQPVTAAHR